MIQYVLLSVLVTPAIQKHTEGDVSHVSHGTIKHCCVMCDPFLSTISKCVRAQIHGKGTPIVYIYIEMYINFPPIFQIWLYQWFPSCQLISMVRVITKWINMVPTQRNMQLQVLLRPRNSHTDPVGKAPGSAMSVMQNERIKSCMLNVFPTCRYFQCVFSHNDKNDASGKKNIPLSYLWRRSF